MGLDVIVVIFILVGLIWFAGVVQILTSDNVPFIKIVLLVIACMFPPFAFIYLLRGALINDFKKAPQRIKNTAATAARATQAAATTAAKTAQWLVKK